MSQQLTVYNSRLGHKQVAKTTVEAEAREAASSGTAIADSCRYPYTSEAGMHFKAVYLLSKSQPEQNEHTRD